jgi:hypothetical protein
MDFDIHQLDNLDFDEAELLLHKYIDELIDQFIESPEGQSHVTDYPNVGWWINSFIEQGYEYEGFTLPSMTQGNVATLMELILPRKITLMDIADAEDAIPELTAFWAFLKREYSLQNAESIILYLFSIKDKFGEWMMDPDRGGMTKKFMLTGMKAGFDMTTQEGLNAFQASYNAQLKKKRSAKKKLKSKQKGFGDSGKNKSSRRSKD